MSASVSFSLDDRAFQRAMSKLQAAGVRMRPLLLEIASELERSTKDRFDLEEEPDGTPWVDLRPDTWKRKRSPKKLQEGGALKGTISSAATDEYAEVLAAEEYAAIHQFGGMEGMAPGPAGIPARPVMGLSAADRSMITRAARDFLTVAPP